MGILGLIPVSKLAAAYNTTTKILHLYSEGDAENYTSGIHFAQNTTLGGFQFSVMGWVGPVTKGTSPYKYTQEFNISLEGRNGYPKELIIADSLHPDGQVIPLKYLGFGEVAAFAQHDVVSGTSAAVTGTGGNHKRLTVLLKEPFAISQLATVPAGGSIHINFDSNFLSMQTAAIQSPVNAGSSGAGDIVWNFNSLKTGITQVTVTIHGGVEAYVTQIVYDVRIIVL